MSCIIDKGWCFFVLINANSSGSNCNSSIFTPLRRLSLAAKTKLGIILMKKSRSSVLVNIVESFTEKFLVSLINSPHFFLPSHHLSYAVLVLNINSKEITKPISEYTVINFSKSLLPGVNRKIKKVIRKVKIAM